MGQAPVRVLGATGGRGHGGGASVTVDIEALAAELDSLRRQVTILERAALRCGAAPLVVTMVGELYCTVEGLGRHLDRTAGRTPGPGRSTRR